MAGFPYETRAAAVAAALSAVNAAAARRRGNATDQAAMREWRAAAEAFRRAVEAAYPPGFDAAVAALRDGRPSGLDVAIDFLAADPFFFRSGYVKADLIRLLTRVPIDEPRATRLRGVALAAVDRCDRREFRAYCRLARRVADDVLRAQLQRRLASPDSGVRRRAGWMLYAIGRRG